MAAAVVAALGATLVFLYVRGAETRAEEKFDTVDVLVATQQIEAGEATNASYASGKIALKAVPRDQVLPGATADGQAFNDLTALNTIYVGEQLIPEKFGGASEVEAETSLPIPKGNMAISINLSDTARVAGFVNPGSEVAIFMTGAVGASAEDSTRLLLDRVTVIAVGSTTQVTTTTTDPEGAQTVEALPRTLFTLSLDQEQVEKVLFAQGHGELAFALLTPDSKIDSSAGTSAPGLFE
ncbi:MAG: Flp pilus assembly protein CpaB [Actinomycetota bacterium]|nr:Flp pilus assembly protein CpaB [Actinomycetota bacterium]